MSALTMPLEETDPLHIELVQIGREDRQKLEPLEKWRPLVLRFVEHAPVELEPGEVAIKPACSRKAVLERHSGRVELLGLMLLEETHLVSA